jgi:poly(A) polymerase
VGEVMALVEWQESGRYGAAREIVRVLQEAGFPAYFAGGCVRDMLLGVAAKDFDVATSATPEVVIGLFAALGKKTFAVGAHFGVVLVCLGLDEENDGREIQTEVATFRQDGAYTDGRRPDAVQFSTEAREDVVRRDFTINGMLYDPMAGEGEPALLDFVGGRKDLTDHWVRAIGVAETRFTEDKLRMLRAVRFAARLDFGIYYPTAAAITKLAPEIGHVSAERIREELTKILTEGGARRGFEWMQRLRLLEQVLPEAVKMIGVEQPPEWHPEGDVWTHTMLLLERLGPGCSVTLAWGALLHDIGKPATYRVDRSGGTERIRFNGHVEVGVRISELILKRLRFSNEDTDQILALVKNHMRFGDVLEMKESTLKRFLRLPRFEEHLRLHWLDCTACHGRLGLWEFATERYHAELVEDKRPAPMVTGRDLIAAGYRPGPRFKEMLLAAEDAQLEGRVGSTEEGLAVVRALFGAA